MIIRKQFKFEGAHVVRNCSSDRCKKSIHGHSYIVEVFLESDTVDNGQMVYDFGLMKGTIGEFVDAFDHTYVMWDKEPAEFKNFIIANSDRVIQMNVSPSAEMFSVMFAKCINNILERTSMRNGEGNVRLKSVRVHETATGWAESTMEDVDNIENQLGYSIAVDFSKAIVDDFNHFSPNDQAGYVNPTVEQQIQTDHKNDREEDAVKVIMDGNNVVGIAINVDASQIGSTAELIQVINQALVNK